MNTRDYITTYSDRRGVLYTALHLPWQVVTEILGHDHTGTAEEDQLIVQVLLAAGAPDWTADAEGWVDEYGWGLIGPRKEEC